MSEWYNAHQVLVQGTFIAFLIALSVQIPIRMGVFSFAGVGFFGIGAFNAAILGLRSELPPLVILTIGCAICGFSGLLLGLLVAKLDGLYLAMATVAFDLILTVVVLNGGTFTGGPHGLYGVLVDFGIVHVLALVAVVVVLVAASEYGRTARRVDALREDPVLATTLGIRVTRLRILSFVLSGLVAGLAGGMHAFLRTTVSSEDIGFSLIVLGLTIIVVGGMLSWLGAAIGSVIFTWLPELLSSAGEWHQVIYGLLVALGAIWMPGGLIGVLRNLGYRRRLARLTATAARAGGGSMSGPPEAPTVERVASP